MRPAPRMTASRSGITKAMWLSVLASLSASAMLWWSLLQRMKAMIFVRSDRQKPSASSKKRWATATSALLNTTWVMRLGASRWSGSVGARRRERSAGCVPADRR
jgi:hypothetical protein